MIKSNTNTKYGIQNNQRYFVTCSKTLAGWEELERRSSTSASDMKKNLGNCPLLPSRNSESLFLHPSNICKCWCMSSKLSFSMLIIPLGRENNCYAMLCYPLLHSSALLCSALLCSALLCSALLSTPLHQTNIHKYRLTLFFLHGLHLLQQSWFLTRGLHITPLPRFLIHVNIIQVSGSCACGCKTMKSRAVGVYACV